jgi:hypothetical protein
MRLYYMQEMSKVEVRYNQGGELDPVEVASLSLPLPFPKILFTNSPPLIAKIERRVSLNYSHH